MCSSDLLTGGVAGRAGGLAGRSGAPTRGRVGAAGGVGEAFEDEAEALRAEQGAHLETALERLPALERALLQRVYVEGMSVPEAGEALGISRSWSGRLHARALAVLRDALAGIAEAL